MSKDNADVNSVEYAMSQIPWAMKGVRQEQERLALWVRRANERGATWQQIGDALGTTRQAAFQRFSVPRVVMEADKYV